MTSIEATGVSVGDRIRFTPQQGSRWWDVEARDDRFIICSQQAMFRPADERIYTIVDLTGWTTTYNFVPPGVVRSSCDLSGGGYDMDREGWAETMLGELQAGELGISRRRVVPVRDLVIKL